MVKKGRIIILFLFTLFASGCLFFIAPAFANAANLYFSSPSNYYESGAVFSLKVYVSSPDQAMNAASGVISFPKDKLEVVSVLKSGSIVNIWVQDPSFSNINGTINFEGIILNPGFIGEAGKIITVNFKAKKAGLVLINFSSGAVLANDGKGSNILKDLGSAQFNVNASLADDAQPSVIELKTLDVPKVNSSTHPDSAKWYSNSSPVFQWNIPEGITDVSFLLDTYPKTTAEKLRGLVTTYTYKDIEDGVWYFHIKFKNKDGWGQAAHFKVQIDTQKPNPIILTFPHGSASLDNRPVALFNTTDSLSGIDHYQVKIGDKYAYQLLPDAFALSNPYVLPPQEPGRYSMKVLAYDKAGNFIEADGNFEIFALNQPQIISIPDKMYEGDFFRIVGRSYPKATVVAILKKNNQIIEEENVFTNTLGQFTLTWPTYLRSGNYEITFFVVDENDSKSLKTPEKILIVEKKYIVNLGIIRLTLAMTAWLNILLFFFINTLIGYWVYYFSHTKNRFNKKLNAVEAQLNELIVYLSTKFVGEKTNQSKPRVNASIAKMKKIIKDIHKL